MISKWLIPWHPIEDEDDCRAVLFAELQREVDSVHPLHGLVATAIGRRQGDDDVLFALADGRLAVVHLTWIGKRDKSPCPYTELYQTAQAFGQDRMIPDHAEWAFSYPASRDTQYVLGRRVRCRSTAVTERLGVAGLLGSVLGETVPSTSEVAVEGACPDDYALMIVVDGRSGSFWIAPDHVEFVDHGVGQA